MAEGAAPIGGGSDLTTKFMSNVLLDVTQQALKGAGVQTSPETQSYMGKLRERINGNQQDASDQVGGDQGGGQSHHSGKSKHGGGKSKGADGSDGAGGPDSAGGPDGGQDSQGIMQMLMKLLMMLLPLLMQMMQQQQGQGGQGAGAGGAPGGAT